MMNKEELKRTMSTIEMACNQNASATEIDGLMLDFIEYTEKIYTFIFNKNNTLTDLTHCLNLQHDLCHPFFLKIGKKIDLSSYCGKFASVSKEVIESIFNFVNKNNPTPIDIMYGKECANDMATLYLNDFKQLFNSDSPKISATKEKVEEQFDQLLIDSRK